MPDQRKLAAGEYRIAGIGSDSISIVVEDEERNIDIALANLTGTMARIPSEIRSKSSNCEWVAPFHLRDDTDEALDELPGNVNQDLREHFGDNEFRSHRTAYGFAELIADSGDYEYIQVCNGYGNTVEMVEMIGMKLSRNDILDIENQIIAESKEYEPAADANAIAPAAAMTEAAI